MQFVMDNLMKNEEDSEINCIKKENIYEDIKNFRELQTDFDTSLSDPKNNNGVNSDGSYNESKDEMPHSPTYISKNYEPLSSSAEDGEDSVSSLIDTKSSEFKNLVETGCDTNVDILKKEQQRSGIEMSSHELRHSISSPSTSILIKSLKRKSIDEFGEESGNKHSQNPHKIFTRNSRKKILKLDSNIAEDKEANLPDEFKKDLADINTDQNLAQNFVEQQNQLTDKYSHSQKIQNNTESKEKYASFQSTINLSSINLLNNILEKTLTSTISEKLLNKNKVRLMLSPQRITNKENVISSEASVCNKSAEEASEPTSPGSETPNRLSIDTDEMIPIQAEVVMSEESENEQIINKNKNTNDRSTYNVKKDVEDYLASFVCIKIIFVIF